MHKRMSPHGDNDHMGEAEMLVENYKVNTAIFNTGKYIEQIKMEALCLR